MADAATDKPDIAESAMPMEDESTPERVEALLREHWGLSGQVFPVEENRGVGYLVDNGHLRYLLNIRLPTDEASLKLEHEVMRHIIRSPDGPQVCEPVPTRDDEEILPATIGGEDRILRLLTVLEGTAPAPVGKLSSATGVSLGGLAASLARSLVDFDQTLWGSEHEDELRKAGPRTVSLLSEVTDQEARDFIARAMVAALRRIHPLTPDFRVGLTVQDLALDILAGTDEGGELRATGITDLGGLAKGWYVSALAKTCARILSSRGGEPMSILPAIGAYHAIDPLNNSEIEALWPLVIGELALNAAIAENAKARAADNSEAASFAARAKDVLSAASAATAPFMQAAILTACGIEPPPLDIGPLLPDIDSDRVRLVDLGVTSPLFHDGNWTDADCDWRLLARIAWETGMGSTRYGEYRLSKATALADAAPDGEAEPANVALHVDICLPAGTPLMAPFTGMVTETSPRLSIRGSQLTLLLEGVATDLADGAEIAGQGVIGKVAGEDGAVGGIRIRLSRDPDNPPPLFCAPSQAGIWRHLAPSPAPLLKLDCDAPAVRPERIGRAWREFLYDEAGRIRLDFTGTAPLVGHGHPAVATAGYRQHMLAAVANGEIAVHDDLRQALAEVAPPSLGHVVLFAGRSEALAALTSLAVNAAPPGTSETGEAARADLPADEDIGEVISELRESDGDGEEPDEAAVPALKTGMTVIEPLPSIVGLVETIAIARKQGHIVVADETRTGYGRLGDAFWAIEQEGLSVDALLAGSCHGDTLSVVFCGSDLADGLYELSSPVSPIAAATALAALRVLRDEQMQANAATIGEILGHGLRQLSEDRNGDIEITGQGFFWKIQLSGEPAKIGPVLSRTVQHDTGNNGTILFLPPLCAGEQSVKQCLASLRQAFGPIPQSEI
ncbi:aminotransferase class III-fold pyridoxal phosphate-dependent enzyme [Neorhizobium sp. NCHU2750]|uniref:aminotransferase class III-fold pyridoxal phosphate-dependent enzyme n=1 Tax=Neorhizobium sp. NCHU2750 TaxID=1825976 RepID=UPI000EB6D3B8|nr:hypothetical protein NCHU2750_36310 [Neorhizobium sp. NCHU2750]